MPKLRVHCFAISIDGYGAGPGQDPRVKSLGRRCTEHTPSSGATHVVLTKRA